MGMMQGGGGGGGGMLPPYHGMQQGGWPQGHPAQQQQQGANGGGGGGGEFGGGGAGGGVLYAAGRTIPAGSYPIKVGVGGKYKDTTDYTKQIQEELELEQNVMQYNGLRRYNDNLKNAVVKNQESTTLYGLQYQAKYISKLSLLIICLALLVFSVRLPPVGPYIALTYMAS